MKIKKHVIVAIAVGVVVIASVLCLVISRERKTEPIVVDGFYYLTMSPWNKTTGLNASAYILAMSPYHRKWNDVTWKLYNVTTTYTVPATFTHQDTDSDGYLDINEWVTVVGPCHGTYEVRAIHNGSTVYQSEAFVM